MLWGLIKGVVGSWNIIDCGKKMSGWSVAVTCLVHVSLLAAPCRTHESSDVFLGNEMETLSLPTYCPRKCSQISSFELRNLQILSPEGSRIEKFSRDMPLDTNLRINYHDVEMAGIKPGFCGNYHTLELPIYSVKESKSNSIQFLRKLYFQSHRDVYTHSECNYKCVFGCRQVGYDEEIMSELLIRDTPDLYVYQCDRYCTVAHRISMLSFS
uniref:Uncharacterized protein n=1 Tax=Setaria digitata TaxID=48799 RepID=A0A915PRX6_9BILA